MKRGEAYCAATVEFSYPVWDHRIPLTEPAEIETATVTRQCLRKEHDDIHNHVAEHPIQGLVAFQ